MSEGKKARRRGERSKYKREDGNTYGSGVRLKRRTEPWRARVGACGGDDGFCRRRRSMRFV